MSIAKLTSRPTAVMAVNDLTAVGVVKGLLKSGYRVPQDISVTGFDKTRLAEYCNPSITTVDVHREALGQMAADALMSCRPPTALMDASIRSALNLFWEIPPGPWPGERIRNW